MKHARYQDGMTILEALIAILILGITTTAITSLIVTGDRIAGRRTTIYTATTLAKSEIERLRAYEKSLVLPKDTLYDEVVNGVEYEVKRNWIPNDTISMNSTVLHREYSVSVTRKINQSVSVSFRTLQGYYGEPTQ